MTSMTTEPQTVKPKKPRKKPERFLSWKRTGQQGVGLLKIQVGKDEDLYHVRRIEADQGQAFEVTKVNLQEPDVYHVNLDGLACSCECKGFLRWSRCKHVDALRTLTERGNI